MKVAALYSKDGRVVTGGNHGEAFSKLSDEEKEGCLTSGFLDIKTGKFTSNEFDCVVKKFVLMRHGHIDDPNDLDPKIDDAGRSQVTRAANFLLAELTINDYLVYTSPSKRCVESAEVLCAVCNLSYEIKAELASIRTETPEEFFNRVDLVIKSAPAKSILISHHNFIIQLVQMASGKPIECETVPYASLTLVNNRNIAWFAKNV
tara:strand:+ start:2812 stop:3426 length:615 start_codon:yes stop_codon:yes gene_type:complete